AKLWSVYISGAEKYDKALVDGWKSDMEGLLIITGLFSASLTALLVESYKTLTPDQGAITIALLAHLSRQLDPLTNTSAVDVEILTAFTPSTSSLACNTLWFLSLGLSLSCALIATLVEQWSRDFITRTEMRPSPFIRARIFSYLYFGLQRFGMHKMVDFLPLLLHMSLLLFFAGLVAFLHPINPVVTAVAVAVLGLISATYIYLTVLPILSSDSPYRTPLSNLVWGSFRQLSSPFRRRRKPSFDEESTTDTVVDKASPTMVEVMMRDAMANSHKRDERDGMAIVWTVRSLKDNNELEPFVEAFSDLIWAPNGRKIINMLLEARDIQLVPRIESLLQSCDTGLLPPDLQTHRQISCIRALWAIAYLS
ncbi:hypothetical protein B0H13DRAFT_1524827, partial [Mycena leptocephala]